MSHSQNDPRRIMLSLTDFTAEDLLSLHFQDFSTLKDQLSAPDTEAVFLLSFNKSSEPLGTREHYFFGSVVYLC